MVTPVAPSTSNINDRFQCRRHLKAEEVKQRSTATLSTLCPRDDQPCWRPYLPVSATLHLIKQEWGRARLDSAARAAASFGGSAKSQPERAPSAQRRRTP
jgi:hypothetical protein